MFSNCYNSLCSTSSSNLHACRCMELAIIHDMAECIIGDITPNCGVSSEEKRRREAAAMEHLTRLIPKNSSYINSLFKVICG